MFSGGREMVHWEQMGQESIEETSCMKWIHIRVDCIFCKVETLVVSGLITGFC